MGQPAGEPRTPEDKGFPWDDCCVVCTVLPFILAADVEKHGRTRIAWSCLLWKLKLG